MSKYNKRYTQKQKLEIINYFKQHGGARTKRRFDLSITSIRNWIEILEAHGPEGLSMKKVSKRENAELIRLRQENKALKTLVADKELELRIKEMLLKKSQ